MKINLTHEEAKWLMSVTGTTTAQEAIDYFVILMSKEGINSGDIIYYIRQMMRRGIK